MHFDNWNYSCEFWGDLISLKIELKKKEKKSVKLCKFKDSWIIYYNINHEIWININILQIFGCRWYFYIKLSMVNDIDIN